MGASRRQRGRSAGGARGAMLTLVAFATFDNSLAIYHPMVSAMAIALDTVLLTCVCVILCVFVFLIESEEQRRHAGENCHPGFGKSDSTFS